MHCAASQPCFSGSHLSGLALNENGRGREGKWASQFNLSMDEADDVAAKHLVRTWSGLCYCHLVRLYSFFFL